MLADASCAGRIGSPVSFSVAALPDPGVVHFYSYATGVSIELPVGFQADSADGADTASARYRDGDALVQVRVVGAFGAGAFGAGAGGAGAGEEAVRALADGFASRGEVLARRDRLVDDCPATTVVTRSGGRVEHETAIAADGRLLAVVAVVPDSAAASLSAAYDAAVDSIRVIPL